MAATMNVLARVAFVGALAIAAVLHSGVAPAVAAELTFEQERRIGAREHPLIVQRYGGEYPDPAVRRYVSEVGARVVQAITATPYEFVFSVLDNGDAYAFALPGGYVYITRQMLALANSEAELAAVLAHEVAHITERHANQRNVLQAELRNAPAAQGAAQMHEFTREQELEADAVSIRLMAKAGYDPMAQARFLTTVGLQADLVQRAGEPGPRDPNTHPSIVERVRRAVSLTHEVERDAKGRRDHADAALLAGYMPKDEPQPLSWVTGREPFLRAIDGLVYGRRPSEGMVAGTTYYDTMNRFSFVLPPGFHFSRANRSVGADGPNGASMMFDIQITRTPPTEGIVAYVTRSVSANFELTDIEERVVDGAMPAVFGRARVSGPGGQPAELLIAYVRVTPTAFFRFQFFLPGPPSSGRAERVLDSPMSLRRLTDAEARAITPLRIHVVTVGEGTEIEALAAQMRALDHPLDWLVMLNRLDPGADPKAGDKIKLVVQ